jgi:hypothetical protein
MTEEEAYSKAGEISIKIVPHIVEILMRSGYGEVVLNIRGLDQPFSINVRQSYQYPMINSGKEGNKTYNKKIE